MVLVFVAKGFRHWDVVDVGVLVESLESGLCKVAECSGNAGASIEQPSCCWVFQKPRHYSGAVPYINEVALLTTVRVAFTMRLEQLDGTGCLNLVERFEDNARHVALMIFIGP